MRVSRRTVLLTPLSAAHSDIGVGEHTGPRSDLLLNVLTITRVEGILVGVDLLLDVGSQEGVRVPDGKMTNWNRGQQSWRYDFILRGVAQSGEVVEDVLQCQITDRVQLGDVKIFIQLFSICWVDTP